MLTGPDRRKNDGKYSGIIPWVDAKSQFKIHANAEGTPSAGLVHFDGYPKSGKCCRSQINTLGMFLRINFALHK